MNCFLVSKKLQSFVCQPTDMTLDILNYFSQLIIVGLGVVFGLLVVLIMLQIFKS